MKKLDVVRDTREQKGWIFPRSDWCEGTTVDTLKTGDYSIKGLEKEFVIERKGSLGEFAQNIVEERFEREMERLEEIKHPFLILEFNHSIIDSFPVNSGIPVKLWAKIRMKPEFIWSKLSTLTLKYKTKIIFAGSDGMLWAERLMKGIRKLYE